MAAETMTPEVFKEVYDAKLSVVNSWVERSSGMIVPPRHDQLIDPHTRTGLDAADKLFRGKGKRVRGVLALVGNEIGSHMSGGEPDMAVMGPAVAALEFGQTFVCGVDDIMDGDKMRRGEPTVDAVLEEKLAGEGGDPAKRAIDYATSVHFIMNNALPLALLRLSTSMTRRVQAVEVVSTTLIETLYGQGRDMKRLKPDDDITVDETLKTAEYKTGRYTALMSLELGAVLSSMRKRDRLKRFTPAAAKFAADFGKAYQLRNDIISTFGENGDDGDCREAKATIPVAILYESGDRKNIQRLRKSLGQAAGGEDYRAALVESGTLERAEEMITHFANAAIASLPEYWPEEPVEFLRYFVRQSASHKN